MVSAILSRCVILVFGLLYPAYASYKAVKTKNVKEYVKWMMYWIVFALFCAVETFSDVFLSWLPFYYEIKMIFVFWLLSPVTKGASFIYRKFVHPALNKREKEIDEAINQAKTKGYSTLMTLGHKGLTYATNVVVTTAMKGQTTLVEHVKKSYSTNDLRVHEPGRGQDTVDGGYIDESEDEFALSKESKETNESKSNDLPEAQESSSVLSKPKKEIAKPVSKLKTIPEQRLLDDNKELDQREKRDPEKLRRRPIQRSRSDASDFKTRRPRPKSITGLSNLIEEEHENSLAMEKESEEEIITEEVIYYSPKGKELSHTYTTKEVKSDPYATLPRTRSRQRPRLHQK